MLFERLDRIHDSFQELDLQVTSFIQHLPEPEDSCEKMVQVHARHGEGGKKKKHKRKRRENSSANVAAPDASESEKKTAYQYRFLSESLTRLLLQLDSVECQEMDDARLRRKQITRDVQHSASTLDAEWKAKTPISL